ncbi:hypothetical protein COV18_04880 [Candidatus Woesearchaeota archaeon CG10_big_fil_rev_8_21_14_0_10_37_12]|nr:MAG: hypothetical protein COV18_04880 [Candidatus Woesearchaeota archaeon CG10_big_fil_rev_8_21_14_0_10_37_12]
MKKLALLLLLSLLLVSATHSLVVFTEVKANILKYEPTPAEQGRTVDIWLQFQNAGRVADTVTLRFDPEYPFSLPPGQPQEIDVGFVASTEDKVEKFTVLVDPEARNGDHTIKFLYKTSAGEQWTYLEAKIAVQTQNAVLIIDDYKIDPTPIKPGQTAEVTLTLKNAGVIGIKNVDVSLDLGDSFSTIGTGTKRRLPNIPAGETETIIFQIASDTSTQVKLYKLPLKLSYQDEKNKQYNETVQISTLINAEPEVSLIVDSTDFENKQKPGTVSLKVINKGIVDLKYVDIRLIKTEDYEILTPSNEAYVGNLDNDDFETVDFILKPLVKEPKLKLEITFKDPYNVDFTQQYDLPLRIITDNDLESRGSLLPVIIVLLIIIAGGIYWWKKKKTNKRR